MVSLKFFVDGFKEPLVPAWSRAAFADSLIHLGKKLLRNPELDRHNWLSVALCFLGTSGINKLVDVLGRSWFFSYWHLFDLIMMSD